MSSIKWTLSMALELIRELTEPAKEAGYFMGLTGGVLSRGVSHHDLDLIAIPLKRHSQDKARLRAVLVDAGLRFVVTRRAVAKSWRERGIDDTKWVEVWYLGARRVDVMFLS